ncbi:transient receptor potential cation channel subfamily M member 7 isoform X1, partial [Tachysurus ichikawai]
CCCGRLVRQHAGFTASLAMKYSDVKLGEGVGLGMRSGVEQEEWSIEKHTEQSPTDAYGIINFQGGSHSYRAKVLLRPAGPATRWIHCESGDEVLGCEAG